MKEITPEIESALIALAPEAMWSSIDGVLSWEDQKIAQPNKQQINDKAKELECIRLRVEAYSKLNQFEMMHDDLVNGTKNWDKTIRKIKKKHPKPEVSSPSEIPNSSNKIQNDLD